MQRLIYFFFILFLCSCSSKYYIKNTEPNVTKVAKVEEDKSINSIIAPFKKQYELQMNEVLTISPKSLIKGKPESTLTNFLADAVFAQVKTESKKEIDFCVLNYGGIRIPELYEGEITKGLIYELLPFDNYLTIVELDFTTLQSFFNHMAKKGGWPISKNVKYILDKNNGIAKNVVINNKPLSKEDKYKVVLPDYIANGGDNCEMLKGINQYNSTIYLRDAIINYLRINKKIDIKLDGRVTYE